MEFLSDFIIKIPSRAPASSKVPFWTLLRVSSEEKKICRKSQKQFLRESRCIFWRNLVQICLKITAAIGRDLPITVNMLALSPSCPCFMYSRASSCHFAMIDRRRRHPVFSWNPSRDSFRGSSQ